MDAQGLLEAYINSPGNSGDEYWDDLSDSVRDLVHRSIGKREIADLEDFEEDCILAIWTKINMLKLGQSETGIDNFEAFIRRAVHNRYCDAIRRKRPTWYNLKLELLEIFSGKANIEGFALWQHPDSGARICGFADWLGSSKHASAKCREIIDNQASFRSKYLNNRDPQELATYELASAIFDCCSGPVEIDVLTSCITDLRQTRTTEPLSIDSQPDGDDESGAPLEWLVSPDSDVEKQVVDSGWFAHVIDWFWKEFVQLSIKQRKALLYGMAGDQVMALGSAVGLKEVAKSLEINMRELASLINKLPVPDAATADELGIQARAVPSVRFKAWGRIRRRTKKSALSLDEEQALI
ncbi:MAG: hypothetical protein ABFD83_09405 [Armatimonadota bacterium]